MVSKAYETRYIRLSHFFKLRLFSCPISKLLQLLFPSLFGLLQWLTNVVGVLWMVSIWWIVHFSSLNGICQSLVHFFIVSMSIFSVCGIPLNTLRLFKFDFPIHTENNLFWKNSQTFQDKVLWFHYGVYSNLDKGTLSNAFSKSQKKTSTGSSLSSACVQYCILVRRFL